MQAGTCATVPQPQPHLADLHGFSHRRCVNQVSPTGLYFFVVFIFYTNEKCTIFTL